jgi:hypothetical protein
MHPSSPSGHPFVSPFFLAAGMFAAFPLAACGGGEASPTVIDGSTPVDASGGDASTASDPCTLALAGFNSSAKVNSAYNATWTCTSSVRNLAGNGIPDHAVTSGNFATPISAQNLAIAFPRAGTVAASNTTLTRQPYGYALNSVKFDPGTDGTCASSATSTAPGGGCVAAMGRDPWNLEAMGGAFVFGTDENNAHVQPNGQYHYHGMPETTVAKAGQTMILVGFAMDGFPMYARYGYSQATDATSAIKKVTPSWQKKANPDAGRPSVSTFPMGTFTQDFEYVAGSGDLDDCNGRVGVTPEYPTGTYHYYITDAYPFIQRCLKGKPL